MSSEHTDHLEQRRHAEVGQLAPERARSRRS